MITKITDITQYTNEIVPIVTSQIGSGIKLESSQVTFQLLCPITNDAIEIHVVISVTKVMKTLVISAMITLAIPSGDPPGNAEDILNNVNMKYFIELYNGFNFQFFCKEKIDFIINNNKKIITD